MARARSQTPPDSVLSRSPFGRSPAMAMAAANGSPATVGDQLPRISEKLEPGGNDPDLRARLLSEKLLLAQRQEQQLPAAAVGRVGSFERRGSAAQDASHMKKAQSYQALADLEKKGYFPAAPTVGPRRSLRVR